MPNVRQGRFCHCRQNSDAQECHTNNACAAGPSGSGKTTLLNALAHRLENNMYSEGELRLNGQPYSRAVLKKLSGYVMQDDLLNVSTTSSDLDEKWFQSPCDTGATVTKHALSKSKRQRDWQRSRMQQPYRLGLKGGVRLATA